MSNQQTNSNKFKKHRFPFFLRLLLQILAGAIVGGFCGLLLAKSAMHSDSNATKYFLTGIWSFLIHHMLWIELIISIFFTGIVLLFYPKLKQQYHSLDITSEESYAIDCKIKQTQSILLWLLHILSAFTFFFFCISFIKLFSSAKSDSDTAPLFPFLLAMLLFVYNMIFIFLTQFQIMELSKKANPQQEGNIFSGNFQKELLDSCDEAQRFEIYKIGYETFLQSKRILFFLSIVLFLCSIVYHPIIPLFIFSLFVTLLMHSIYLHIVIKSSK